MDDFATVEDIESIGRELSAEETERATSLLEVVSNSLRAEADKVGKNLDKMVEEKPFLKAVAKSVTVDVTLRALMTPTDKEPMSQYTESALGYSTSGTYLVPGGGLFIKRSELARLGLKRQQMGVIDFDPRADSNTTTEN